MLSLSLSCHLSHTHTNLFINQILVKQVYFFLNLLPSSIELWQAHSQTKLPSLRWGWGRGGERQGAGVGKEGKMEMKRVVWGRRVRRVRKVSKKGQRGVLQRVFVCALVCVRACLSCHPAVSAASQSALPFLRWNTTLAKRKRTHTLL